MFYETERRRVPRPGLDRLDVELDGRIYVGEKHACRGAKAEDPLRYRAPRARDSGRKGGGRQRPGDMQIVAAQLGERAVKSWLGSVRFSNRVRARGPIFLFFIFFCMVRTIPSKKKKN